MTRQEKELTIIREEIRDLQDKFYEINTELLRLYKSETELIDNPDKYFAEIDKEVEK